VKGKKKKISFQPKWTSIEKRDCVGSFANVKRSKRLVAELFKKAGLVEMISEKQTRATVGYVGIEVSACFIQIVASHLL
jgi:hypothetical protein